MRPKLILGIAAALAVLVVGGSWFYIKVLSDDPPAKLTINDSSTGTTAPSPAGADDAATDGEWKVTSESVVGYRIEEILFGASAVAVGRTNQVEGAITIVGTTATKGSFTVDMASVSSDRTQRDGQFRTRIMETSQFPTSTFELTAPIALSTVEADKEMTTKATGKLTLHGVTKAVSFDVVAKLTNGQIRVNGAIPVRFTDYAIDDPSGGPAQVGEDGILEFTLVFKK